MREALTALLADDLLPAAMPDASLMGDYLRRGCPHGDPICLSFGETWYQAAPGLTRHLRDVDQAAHGYQLSMYGLPALRRVATDQMVKEHDLPATAVPGRHYDLAVTWTGTRSAMYDFGRYLLDRHPTDSRTPVIVMAGPTWDYPGVFSPLGYRVRYFELRPEQGFAPDVAALAQVVADIEATGDERFALLVINSQHNPTAVNWSEQFVETATRTALEHGAALLIDDAYFAVRNDGVQPTSALRILLNELADRPADQQPHWLAVRSLGKQFHCNGWGLGTMVSDPTTLATLVNGYRLHNCLMYGGVNQHAMAAWLDDPASADFLADQRAGYARKRELVGEFLRDRLGYPPDAIHLGECSSYLLFALPTAYAALDGGTELFKIDVFDRTGVLFAPAWPWPYQGDATVLPWMRMFLGPDIDHLREALERLAAAGITYGASPSDWR